jgi:hypothetical protein
MSVGAHAGMKTEATKGELRVLLPMKEMKLMLRMVMIPCLIILVDGDHVEVVVLSWLSSLLRLFSCLSLELGMPYKHLFIPFFLGFVPGKREKLILTYHYVIESCCSLKYSLPFPLFSVPFPNL